MVIAIAALAAANTKVCSPQSLGHATGGDPIHLHHKDDKNQCARKRRNEPLSIMISGVNRFMPACYEIVI